MGGTWWDNQYPGAEVDVDSYVYSFPFKRYDWTRTHARQAEIHRYLEETVSDFGLTPHLRLGTGVQRAVWDDDAHVYRLTLTTGEETECHVLVSAVGFLNVPNYPDWPGLDDFEGPSFHTSRWEHQHDLAGKTVAVVGTGSTASQLVPALATGRRQAATSSNASPGWVLPKGDRDYTPEERVRLHNPFVHRCPAAQVVLGDGEAALERRRLPAGSRRHTPPPSRRGTAVHRQDVRGPSRPRGRSHAQLPVLGEAADLQLRLLSGAEARRTWSSCRGRSRR